MTSSHCQGLDQPAPAVESKAEWDDSVTTLLQKQFFVNGFVCETPVVIDVDRVATLLQRLTHAASASTSNAGPVAGSLKRAAEKASRRLEMLLADVNIPPPLPPIILGAQGTLIG